MDNRNDNIKTPPPLPRDRLLSMQKKEWGICVNKMLLHIEGLVILSLSLYFYSYNQLSWVLFFVLLLAPDISMLGYVINKKIGAVLYNICHTYSLSIGVVVCGVVLSNQIVLAIGIIWTAHIGMDRAVGFGLKYPTDFKDTHLNRV